MYYLTKECTMYAINDALADQIIRASVSDGPAAAARYRSVTQRAALRAVSGSSRPTPLATLRAAVDRLAAMFTPAPAQPACCAIA
jgi:hypothetical protein